MAETKDDIAAERDELRQALDVERAKVAELQQKLGTVGAAARPANPEPRFELSAGEQADLQLHGFTRSVRDSSVIVASDYPDLVDRASMTKDALEADDRERRKRDGARTHEG